MDKQIKFLIRVDRSVKPSYTNWFRWFKKLMHPELELTGPAEYDLQTEVEEWLHDDQKSGPVLGQVIYVHLKKNNSPADHPGVVDLWAVQAKGSGRPSWSARALF